MGVITNNEEFSCPVSPSRMFHALFLDAHNLMPKLMPETIKSVEILSGEGGPGSIEQINFAEGSPFKYAKHRLDAVDKDNFVCKYSVIEGDVLGDKLEQINFEVKFEAAENGRSSVCKITSKHHTKGNAELKQEEITAQKEKAMEMYKVVEKYLTENPTVYA